MLVSTVKLTISKEQQARARKNNPAMSMLNPKVSSFLLSKAKVVRGNSGKSRSLTRTQSAFEVRKNNPKNKTIEQKALGMNFDEMVNDIDVDEKSRVEDITGGEADAGAGGEAAR